MLLIKKILHKAMRLHYPQEYLCLALEQFRQPLYVYIADAAGKAITDITEEHLFVGYKPVIIVLPQDAGHIVSLIFTTEPVAAGTAGGKQAIARLTVEKIRKADVNGTAIHFYKGIKGLYSFLNPIQQLAAHISNRLFNNKPGNVYLEGNLYSQVQIAYAIPRKICLITVGEGGRYNLFPTDLHGAYGNYYIISLRKDGKACAQVQKTKHILISDMQASAFNEVYALGKNHMQEMKEESTFGFPGMYSEQFKLPVPLHALRYKELELASSFDCGIHRLLIFKIVNKLPVNNKGETLAHIHNVYATWRHHQQLDTKYYLKK